MEFGQRLAGFRKEKRLDPASPGRTHQRARDPGPPLRGRRLTTYLDVIRRLAVALQVSAEVLIFGADERGPDGELLLQFEAISKFASEERKSSKLYWKA